MFQLILHRQDWFDVQHRTGTEIFKTNNVMQADCAFTRYRKEALSGDMPFTSGRSVVLLHNDNIRREFRNPVNCK